MTDCPEVIVNDITDFELQPLVSSLYATWLPLIRASNTVSPVEAKWHNDTRK